MELAEEEALLARGLRGAPKDLEALVVFLTPVIQARVARALLANSGGAHRNLREEVEDMTQEVFTVLFENDCRVLRAWRADGGLSLRNFVGMIARRKVGAILVVRKRNPWYEQPMEAEAVERALAGAAEVERRIVDQQLVAEAIRRTEDGLSERGRELLQWFIRDGMTQDEVRARTSMSDAAIYQWKSRITKALRDQLVALNAEAGMGTDGGGS